MSLPSLATTTTYQAGGFCRQINCNNSKINSHFFLAMPATLASTKDSGDSKRETIREKLFTRSSNPATSDQESKASNRQVVRTLKGNPIPKERMGKERFRKEWEGTGRNGKETIHWESIHPLKEISQTSRSSQAVHHVLSFQGFSPASRRIAYTPVPKSVKQKIRRSLAVRGTFRGTFYRMA